MNTLITGETWGETIEPVRAFLLREADRPLVELLGALESAAGDLREQLDGVSDEQAQFVPPTGEGEDAWGIAEVLRHIASVQPLMAQRVRLLGSGQSVEGLTRTQPGYLADVQTRRVTELLKSLDESYEALRGAVAAINGKERLDTVAAHRRFGELNCRGWVALHTLHLRDHARQIGRIKQLSGYPRR